MKNLLIFLVFSSLLQISQSCSVNVTQDPKLIQKLLEAEQEISKLFNASNLENIGDFLTPDFVYKDCETRPSRSIDIDRESYLNSWTKDTVSRDAKISCVGKPRGNSEIEYQIVENIWRKGEGGKSVVRQNVIGKFVENGRILISYKRKICPFVLTYLS